MESKSKSSAAMVTASATKKSPTGHKFHMLEVMPAANGFTLKQHHPREESAKGKDGYPMYTPPPDPTETVWGGDDAQAMLDHIGGLMGMGKAAGNKDQKSGSSKDKKPASGKMDAADKAGEGADEGEDDDD